MTMHDKMNKKNWGRYCAAWAIHAFTASGAGVGLLALLSIYQNNLLQALWLMCAAIFIDAIDGMFARGIKVKEVIPQVDGALLDNIVDFFNYTMVPCFFLLATHLLPESWKVLCVMIITFSSAYQFTQVDAKTTDHFFKGFPSYWNIAVFYLFFWQMTPITNMTILMVLAVLSFVPIKYVYPSRLEYLTNSEHLRFGMAFATLLWGFANSGLLWLYPRSNYFLVAISLGYMLFYLTISLYRTWRPLETVTSGGE